VTSTSIPDSGSPLSCQLTFSHYIYVFINFSKLSNSGKELRYEEHMGFQVIIIIIIIIIIIKRKNSYNVVVVKDVQNRY